MSNSLDLESVWRGPHQSAEAAFYQARLVANRRQVPASVYYTGEEVFGETIAPGFRVYLASDRNGKGALLKTIEPNPEEAPFERWPVVKVGATTDRTQRDLEVEHWRDYAKRKALRHGSKTKLPYHVKVRDKNVSLFGRQVGLYCYIVRKNPTFKFRPTKQDATQDTSQDQPSDPTARGTDE